MPKPLHFELSVLMTADAIGGVWTYAMELASRLAERRVKVYLATLGEGPSDAQREQATRVPGLALFENNEPLEWMDDPWDGVRRAGQWLLELERETSPDVVHLNGYCHGALPWRAPVLMVGHSCVLSWWEAVKGEPAPPRYRRYREEVSRGIQGASALVAPTRAMLTALIRHYGPHPAARVVPNGYEALGLTSRQEKQPIVFCATRVWDEAKNVAALAKAAEKTGWPIFVAGETKNPNPSAEVHFDGVTLLGKLDRLGVMNWMARSSIFALPARYEPFGLSALEAAGAGAALVLGDIPSLREIWCDAAVFVPPDDTSALSDAINTLAKDEQRRKDLAERARERARGMSARGMAEQYKRIYCDLMRAQPTRKQRPIFTERTA